MTTDPDTDAPGNGFATMPTGSGLHGLVLGQSTACPIVMTMLQARRTFDAGRFRDAWMENHPDGFLVARVHTRNGGSNRTGLADQIASMRAHPWYLSDADDAFDRTYADFYFTVDADDLAWFHTWMTTDTDEGPAMPVDHADEVIGFLRDEAQAPVDMKARWDAAIARLGDA